MAFMMPVMKNNYEIYPALSKTKKGSGSSGGGGSGTNSNRSSRPNSRTVSESEKGNPMDFGMVVAAGSGGHFLSTSPPGHQLHRHQQHPLLYSRSAPPPSTLAVRSQRVRFCRSVSHDGRRASRQSTVSANRVSPGSNSTSSSVNGSSTVSSTTGSNSNVDSSSPSPKFGSLTKFHTKLVDSLKRKLKIKDVVDDVCGPSEEDSAIIRAST